jgi:RNA polymerase sigma-70 factor, ECF subfamily
MPPLSDDRSSAPPELLSTRELVESAKIGDKRAFEVLIEQARPMLESTAILLVGNRADADDCVQNALSRAFNGLPKFAGQSSFGTWIYRILRRVCARWLKSRGRDRHVCLEHAQNGSQFVRTPAFSEPIAPPEPDRVAAHELRQRIEAALEKLSPPIRTTFMLFAAKGLSYKEVAEQQGIPIGTVMSRIHAAREKLQEYLGDVRLT